MPFSFYIREEVQTQDGKCTIYLNYSHAGKTFRTPANFKGGSPVQAPCEMFIKRKDFEELKSKRKIKAGDRKNRVRLEYGQRAQIINARLDEIEETARNIIIALKQTGSPTVRRFKEEWELAQGNSRVMGVFDKYIEFKQSKNKSESTIRNLRNLQKRIEKFDSSIRFSSFNESFFDRYAEFFQDLSQGTLKLDSNNLKAFLNWSHARFHYRTEYQNWEVQPGQANEVYLTPEELLRIEGVKNLPWKNDSQVVDIFLFLCHTGMRINEYLKLGPDNLDGEILRYKLSKKGVDASGNKIVKESHKIMSPTLSRIWDKYKGNLPKFSDQHINKRLKVIAKLAGIKKVISTSIGRHTHATLMYQFGYTSIEIAEALGHASDKTTKKTYINAEKENSAAVLFDMKLREA